MGNRVLACGLALLLLLSAAACSSDGDSADTISMPASSKDFAGENYQDVVDDLQSAGFTNVATNALGDLIVGWLKKDGAVDKVGIDGDPDFKENSRHPRDVEIVVSYHSFPVDDGEVSATSAPTPSPLPSPEQGSEPDAPETTLASAYAPTVGVADSSSTQLSALALLETLPVKGRAPKTGYDRKAKFGTPWLDVDRNGCDTRNDILARDLTPHVKSGPCKVVSGTLEGPYTGETIAFIRGNTTSLAVQVDHVVALMNAWETGAQQLSMEQRVSFANDPINLFAVDGPTNSRKGAGDAATWLPPKKDFRCVYVARQVSVKATYDLWVTQAEHDAIARVLKNCPDEPSVTSTFTPPAPTVAPKPTIAPKPAPAPVPAPVPAPAPAPIPAPAPAPAPDVYYANCTAARAAGVTPIYKGQPGYAKKLDRDGDGIACE